MIHDLKPYPAYKDSGVPWLGEVPEHWEVVRCGRLFREIVDTGHPDAELLSIDRVRGIIRQSETGRKERASEDRSSYKKILPGELAYNLMNAFMGSIGISTLEGIISPAYAVARPLREIEPAYFHYLFRTQLFTTQFDRYSYGIMYERNRLYFERFKMIPTIVPSITEQSAIVHYLDYIDRRIRHYIRAKKKLIKLLEEQKQAIIHQAVTRGLDPNVELKQSGVKWIEEIPKHWKIMRLGFLTHVIDPQPDHRAPALATGEGFPYVGIRDVNSDGSINVESARKVEETAIIKQESSFKIEENDIVFCKIGTLGFPRLIKPECRIALSATLVLIKTKSTVNSHYLKYYLDSKSTYTQIDLLSTGSTRPALGIGQIRRILICIPPLTEQQLIVNFLDFKTNKIDTLIYKLSSQVEELKNYRTRLIADVVTGKLDVREAAANLPEETDEKESFDDSLAEDEELESNQIENEQAGELEDEVLA